MKMKRKVQETAVMEMEKENEEELSDLSEEEDGDEGGAGPGGPLKKSRVQGKSLGDGVLKAVKLTKQELYKPPTNEELNRLQETESLFHSSLLRMQMEELLKEVTLSERRRKTIDSLVQEVTSLLASVPETTDTELSDQSWVPRGVKVPLLQVPYSVKGRFRMAPPLSVKLVGSYPLGTCSKPDVNVDLAVTMPAILHPKDYLNQRYHRKRALYLTGLAHHLSSSHAFGSLRFTYHHGNHLRPLLLLTPQGKEERSVTLRLHVCPPAGFFKPSRFHPRKNNVRTAWFLDQETPQQDISEPPTPHYNNSVLSDMLLESHKSFLSASAADFPGFREGVAVIKVWLRQRELHQGYGCFSGFLASMLVAYLLSKHKINSMMSAYQVLRNVLQFLATTDLTESGITLAKGTDSTVPALSEFHDAFQVVFVDPSGHVNLCGDMTASKYRQVQHEARLSMQVWDNPKLDGFHALLMTPKPLVRTFDHIFHLPAVVKLQAACKKMELLSELMDHAGNYVAAALPFIMSLLQRGLGDRVRLLAHSLPQSPEWTIDSEPPKHKDKGLLSFGLLLNPEFSTNTLERGPPADSAQALEFRKLWGERAELRRFQDGSICEAVVWQGGSAFQKRLIPEQIIKHLLQLHANIPESSVCYMGALLDEVIKVVREGGSTGEEASVQVIQSYDDLSRKLWNLDGLPLTVTSVQGAHPALRYTQVFPPVPMKPDYSFFRVEKSHRSLLPLEGKPCPAYVPAIKVICHMEGSGKWPQDREAIRHIKAAFHIRLGELLGQQHRLTCRPAPTHLDVYKDGLVFRVQVAYHRELQILRETVTPEGMVRYRDNEEALRLELETVHRPYLTSTLHGLQQQHSVFGATARLAKRWIGAHLLSASLSEESVDLLAASLFLQPAPHTAPSSPQVGFLRFLHLLVSFDWRNDPLIVNLNGDITATEITEIRNDFIASRSSLPAMFIATPKDKKNSVWTKEGPSVQILQRLIVLAAESLRVLETQLTDPTQPQDVKMVLRPPLDIYDVLIHLNPKQVPLHAQAVDTPRTVFSRGALPSGAAGGSGNMPVVDFNPVACYLSELRDAFEELALFFCDPFGGTVIAVLWKPQAFAPQPFRTAHVKARLVQVKGSEAQTVPNVEAILEDFETLGAGLVREVEVRSERWTV